MAHVAVEGTGVPTGLGSEAEPSGRPRAPLPRRARTFLRKHARALPWIAVLVVAAAVVAHYGLRYLASFESTDDAQVDGNVTAVAARVAGTVVAVHVEDNDRVKTGDPLVELDPADYRVAVNQAEANLEIARVQGVAGARAQSRLAQVELARAQKLVEKGAIPPEELDTRQATSAARAADVAGNSASVKAAQAGVDQARLNLGYTRIAAPVDGIVGQKQVNVGDRVQPGQELLAVVQVNNLWITANFKETQLRDMRPGQEAVVFVDALGEKFRGHVESMPGASGARFSLLPPENATGNYVKVVQRLPVRIRLEPGQANLDRLRPGMSVEPKVWLR